MTSILPACVYARAVSDARLSPSIIMWFELLTSWLSITSLGGGDAFGYILDEHGEFFSELLFDFFGLFFPYEAIFLMTSDEFEQSGFLLIVQAVEGLDFFCEFYFVHD